MWQTYALLAALFASLTAICSKLGVRGINSDLATAIRVSFILILTWGVVFAGGAVREIRSLSAHALLFLFLSAIATGLSWLFYFKALDLADVSRVAPLDKLSVAFTIILAAIFLGEAITWKTALGGLLIVAGSLVLLF